MAAVAFVSTRYVDPGHENDYHNWCERVLSAATNFPGFTSAEQIPAAADGQAFWTQIIRFEDKESSLRWRDSAELRDLIAEVDSYSHDSEVSAVRLGKSDWINFGFSTKPGPGAPIKWKQWVAGVMALFPTVVIVHEILSAVISVPFAVSTLLTNAISMFLVMMIWLPLLSKALGFWLLPKKPVSIGLDIGVTCGLLAIIAVLTVIFLALFPG